jgi:cation:H+ antiporter
MLIAVFLFTGGLILLYLGAESLVAGSSRLALSFGIRPLIIGMTIVAFATSMPELMISLIAAVKGSPDLAVGNIIGSNIANIGLILGIAALMSPMKIPAGVLTRELPFMIGAALLLYFFAFDGILGRLNGIILFSLLLVFLGYCLRTARDLGLDRPMRSEAGELQEHRRLRKKSGFLILFGMGGLGVGAELMVRSAVFIATAMGISEMVIGLSIVAVGTSLPEMAASVVSVIKGEMDLSIGNVIGSNIFNILFVLGLLPIIHPLAIDPSVLRFEFPVMLLFSIVLIPMVLHRHHLGRIKGCGLLTAYLAFIIIIYL